MIPAIWNIDLIRFQKDSELKNCFIDFADLSCASEQPHCLPPALHNFGCLRMVTPAGRKMFSHPLYLRTRHPTETHY